MSTFPPPFTPCAQDAIMCLEIHNITLYKGMSDRLYRTIDKEASGFHAIRADERIPPSTGGQAPAGWAHACLKCSTPWLPHRPPHGQA